MEPVDEAPCFFSGSLTLGGCGLPSTDRLADRFVAGNGKIQGGSAGAVVLLVAINDSASIDLGITVSSLPELA